MRIKSFLFLLPLSSSVHTFGTLKLKTYIPIVIKQHSQSFMMFFLYAVIAVRCAGRLLSRTIRLFPVVFVGRVILIRGGRKHSFISEVARRMNKEEEKLLQISKKTTFRKASVLFSLFALLIFSNWAGLFVFIQQSFLGKLSLSLLIMTARFWALSYLPFVFANKEKFTLFLVGDIKFPILSFLLSNIEILTQFFRPITLMARLWVNIGVGHLLIRTISFTLVASLTRRNSFLSLPLIALLRERLVQGGFFCFEVGIISLQAFVFTYLVGVYLGENSHFAERKF